jgi:hypothetical protein
MGRWEHGKMKMGTWADGNMGRWEHGQMGTWADGNMGRWEHRKMKMGTNSPPLPPLPTLSLNNSTIF